MSYTIRKGEYISCKVCGKERYVSQYLVKLGKVQFCSVECRRFYRSKSNPLFKSKDVLKKCINCGSDFYVLKSRDDKGEGIYCSQKCFGEAKRGDNSYNWNSEKRKCKYCGCEFYYCHSPSKPLGYGKYCSNECRFKSKKTALKGSNNPNWKSGKTNLVLRIRGSRKYEEWRTKVYIRDKFICVKCGYKDGGVLNAHHIIPLATILERNNIKTMEDADNCHILWDSTNGETLCSECHKAQHKTKIRTTKLRIA